MDILGLLKRPDWMSIYFHFVPFFGDIVGVLLGH